MPLPITKSDIHKIAAGLSGVYGVFPADGVVSYGRTAIIKPGACTEDGKVLTGADVQRMLGADFQVFPLAVEYAPSAETVFDHFGEAEADIDEIEQDLDDAEDVEQDDEFGARVRRVAKLEKKYLKALAKLAKCQTLLQAGKGRTGFARKLLTVAMPFSYFVGNSKSKRLKNRAKKCDRLFDRLKKVRAKMVKKGIDVSRLPRPDLFMADVATRWERKRFHASRPAVMVRPIQGRPMVRPTGGGYVPVSKRVQEELYHRDQAALENEMNAVMPSYGADVQQIIEDELSAPMLGADDAELSADLRADAMGYVHSGVEHDYFGIAGSDAETMWDDGSFLEAQILLRDEDDQDLLEDDTLYGDEDLVDQELGADDASGDELGEDEVGEDDGVVDAALSEDDESLGEDDDLGADESDEDEDILGAMLPDDDSDLLEDDDEEDDGGETTPDIEEGRELAVKRAGLSQIVAEKILNDDFDGVDLIKEKIDKISEKFKMGSTGVNYKRLQPRAKASVSEPVIVIAVQKRPPVESSLKAKLRSAFGDDAGLIDVFGAQMAQTKHGYTPVESMQVLRDVVRPSEWVRGSQGKFPAGDGAPLPAPRRIGREVG